MISVKVAPTKMVAKAYANSVHERACAEHVVRQLVLLHRGVRPGSDAEETAEDGADQQQLPADPHAPTGLRVDRRAGPGFAEVAVREARQPRAITLEHGCLVVE